MLSYLRIVLIALFTIGVIGCKTERYPQSYQYKDQFVYYILDLQNDSCFDFTIIYDVGNPTTTKGKFIKLSNNRILLKSSKDSKFLDFLENKTRHEDSVYLEFNIINANEINEPLVFYPNINKKLFLNVDTSLVIAKTEFDYKNAFFLFFGIKHLINIRNTDNNHFIFEINNKNYDSFYFNNEIFRIRKFIKKNVKYGKIRLKEIK